jgi:hypothetical protein
MPQLKIGHLRALPSVPPPARAALANLGRALGQRNRGISASERAELDAVVFDALQLSRPERALVETWTAATPPPRARVRKH